MIHVFYNRSVDKLNNKTFNRLFHQLPVTFQKSLLKFRKWEDTQRALLGKILLIHGLQSLHLPYLISDLKYTEFNRPYFNDMIDFNISHSGAYTVCAITTGKKLGIDVEEIKDLSIEEFTNEFSKKEIDDMIKAENSLYQFYNLWTKKEAFLKAIGTGLQVPLHLVNIKNNSIYWNKVEWFFSEVKLDSQHICHLCLNDSETRIETENIEFI